MYKFRQNVVIKVTKIQLTCSIFSVKFQKFEKILRLPKKFTENIFRENFGIMEILM